MKKTRGMCSQSLRLSLRAAERRGDGGPLPVFYSDVRLLDNLGLLRSLCPSSYPRAVGTMSAWSRVSHAGFVDTMNGTGLRECRRRHHRERGQESDECFHFFSFSVFTDSPRKRSAVIFSVKRNLFSVGKCATPRGSIVESSADFLTGARKTRRRIQIAEQDAMTTLAQKKIAV